MLNYCFRFIATCIYPYLDTIHKFKKASVMTMNMCDSID